ncbi:alkaline phosphatase D family protein [Blastopirellula sp. JC732]|uniref:Alkaline phosphatase D family protein n=1 Tax=Blastopirellula sediminis TaxID=2894196 RepID=A0A9X1SIK7_9BACT|nr:alkaline phosphatase D family protein [Blastopirellula sediminis]MCC9605774.1 alkaline phosphatase D family protein [Blastopirellula sediminis]MCC9630926.1 alkaline phosphatase D family protein [Blastopirellula sediminis]
MHRRSSLKLLAAGIPLSLAAKTFGADAAGPFFGSGVKVGEATSDSAIIWTRTSAIDECDKKFALPGVAAKVRVRYRIDGMPDSERTTDWQATQPEHDFAVQFALQDLTPGVRYRYVVEAESDAGKNQTDGTFETAPTETTVVPIRFIVTSCHKYATMDAPGLGQKIYRPMLDLAPQFFVHTGDIVYYDNDTKPLATNVELARLHWHRMDNLPYHRQFYPNVASYFMKDDHDILKDDAWPGQKYGDLTFAEGLEIFDEQNPLGESPYRTIRWGKDLQVWIVEGRDFRSPNRMADGPDKSIWGEAQWKWLQETVAASDATFKILISPTPIVGPDRPKGKNDNHSNAVWKSEGDRARRFLVENKMISICGDRHWQYYSVDEETGLNEFCSGPSTNQHAGGWSQDNVLPEHRFLRVAGGFLSVDVERSNDQSELIFRHRDVAGDVVHEQRFAADGES